MKLLVSLIGLFVLNSAAHASGGSGVRSDAISVKNSAINGHGKEKREEDEFIAEMAAHLGLPTRSSRTQTGGVEFKAPKAVRGIPGICIDPNQFVRIHYFVPEWQGMGGAAKVAVGTTGSIHHGDTGDFQEVLYKINRDAVNLRSAPVYKPEIDFSTGNRMFVGSGDIGVGASVINRYFIWSGMVGMESVKERRKPTVFGLLAVVSQGGHVVFAEDIVNVDQIGDRWVQWQEASIFLSSARFLDKTKDPLCKPKTQGVE